MIASNSPLSVARQRRQPETGFLSRNEAHRFLLLLVEATALVGAVLWISPPAPLVIAARIFLSF